jgi:hypothetical protein
MAAYVCLSSRGYLVPQPNGSITLGGGLPLYRADESVWYDMVDDGALIESVQDRWYEGYMRRHFHGWSLDGKTKSLIIFGLEVISHN